MSPYTQPELEYESHMADDGTLVLDVYCEVCDSSETFHIGPLQQERDGMGNMPTYAWANVTEGIAHNHDCLAPLRELAASTNRQNWAIKLGKLACRALGENY